MKKSIKYACLAQSVEQLAVNQWVVGSSPTAGAKSQLTLVSSKGTWELWNQKLSSEGSIGVAGYHLSIVG